MNESQRFGLAAKSIELLRSVFSKYSKIEKVLLYGSRAKGTFKPGSDIDLTIIGENVDLTTQLKIENEIDDLMMPYKVDLSLFHLIENPDLTEHIHRVGVQIYPPINT